MRERNIDMRKFHLLWLALVVVAALCAVSAASASAVELVWLVEGVKVEANLRAETEGELELISLDKETHEILNIILCSGIFVGMIGPNGKDTVTGLEDLVHKPIGTDLSTGLTGEPLSCTVTFKAGALTDCNATAPNNIALVWIANVPWTTQLVLMEPPEVAEEEWLDLFGPGTGGEPGYEVECTTLLNVKATDLCVGHTSALILMLAEEKGVHGEFNFEAPINSEEGTCTSGNLAATRGLGITWDAPEPLIHLETTVSEV
jgi:hypothetical protein